MIPAATIARAAMAVTVAMMMNGSAIAAPVSDKSITTMELFWKYCDRRNNDSGAFLFCFSYIMGHVDAAITIGKYVKSGPSFCLSADDSTALFERIVSYVPTRVRGGEDAGVFVQAAVAVAMRCD